MIKKFELYNTLWLIFDKVFRLFVGLWLSVLIAKNLGSELFGEYNYIVSLMAIVSVFIAYGTNAIVLKYVSQGNEEIIDISFILRMIAYLIFFVVFAILILFLELENKYNYILMAFILLFKPFDVVKVYFESIVQVKMIVTIGNIVFILISAAKLYIIYQGVTVSGLLLIALFESALTAVGFFYAYYRKKSGEVLNLQKVNLNYIIKVSKESFPLIFSSICWVLYTQIDKLMVGELIGKSELGVYSISVMFADLSFILPAMLFSSIIPGVLVTCNKDEEKFNSKIITTYTIMMYLSLCCYFFTSAFATYFIPAYYGSEYYDSVGVLYIYGIGVVFSSLMLVSGKYMIQYNLQRLMLKRQMLGLLINVGLNIVLIPNYGSEGAAVASVISLMIVSLFSDLFSKRTIICFKQKIMALNFLRLI
ncbi:flippase [Vibrio sp. OPT18]|uniref:flippase n=1 Tax=Vibrio sp. OPT18 TaxID=2778641 RepID=UPI00188217BE|nr:flippase [Vibrio sp. OPT18]MBE8578481.1 flippase [Vibrio sp. OPT18]